jgi:hypothetical protein
MSSGRCVNTNGIITRDDAAMCEFMIVLYLAQHDPDGDIHSRLMGGRSKRCGERKGSYPLVRGLLG